MRQLTHLFSPCTSVDGTFLTASCSWFFHFSPQWVKFFFLSSHKLPSLNVSTCLLPQLPVNLGNKVQYPPHKKPFINLNSVIQSRKQLSHFTCAEDFILGHLCGKGCLGLIELSGYLHRSTGVLYIEQGHLITAPVHGPPRRDTGSQGAKGSSPAAHREQHRARGNSQCRSPEASMRLGKSHLRCRWGPARWAC